MPIKPTGVQRIYLDEQTAGKTFIFGQSKTIQRILEGSGYPTRGMSAVYTYEGPETAASIAHAFPIATVIASFASVISKHAPIASN